jgi:hypothetical protein
MDAGLTIRPATGVVQKRPVRRHAGAVRERVEADLSPAQSVTTADDGSATRNDPHADDAFARAGHRPTPDGGEPAEGQNTPAALAAETGTLPKHRAPTEPPSQALTARALTRRQAYSRVQAAKRKATALTDIKT